MAVETNHFIAFYTFSSNTQLTEINNGTKKPIHIFIDFGVNLGHTISVKIFLLTPPNIKNQFRQKRNCYLWVFLLKRAIRNKT